MPRTALTFHQTFILVQTVIIGNGISGITTAITLRKHDPSARIIVISGERDAFFARTALMYVYLRQMRPSDLTVYPDWFWVENRIERVSGWVNHVDFNRKRVCLQDGSTLAYDRLVLATGSKPKTLPHLPAGVKGVQGFYHWKDLEQMESGTKGIRRAVVVGGGLIGIELVEMLRSRSIETHFLIRENRYGARILPQEEADLVHEEIRLHGVQLHLDAEVAGIQTDVLDRIESVLVRHSDGQGVQLPSEFLGVAIGVAPNIDGFSASALTTSEGILVNDRFETNVPDVFAVGDCAEFKPPYPQQKRLEQWWYTGKMHGEVLGAVLSGKITRYQPIIPFNSARFFGLVFQVYGQIRTESQSGVCSFFWRDPKRRRSFRVDYDARTEAVLGIMSLGIRLRHAVCSDWIRQQTPVNDVMASLRAVRFDPEFSAAFESDVVRQFAQETGRTIRI